MNKFKLLAFVTLSLVLLGPGAVWALEQPSFGGNNASDYQPPTGNPQTNNPTSLQPTNTSLQPVTLLNQQTLVQSGALSVLTAPDKGANSTAAEAVVKKHRSTLPTWIIGGLLTLGAVGYILYKPDRSPDTVTAEAVIEQPQKISKPKTTKKPAKKSNKKKKAKRR